MSIRRFSSFLLLFNAITSYSQVSYFSTTYENDFFTGTDGKGCSARARLKARANRAKSGAVNFSRRLSRRTTIKDYRSERKRRRSFDAAIEYGTAAIIATEKT